MNIKKNIILKKNNKEKNRSKKLNKKKAISTCGTNLEKR